MKYFYIILITIALSLVGSTVAAQDNRQFQKDSLRKAIAETEGKDKLSAYSRLANLYYIEAQDAQKRDTLFALYDEMDKEAEKQGNNNSRGNVRANKLFVLDFSGLYDDIIELAPEFLKFAKEKELWTVYYQLYSPLISAYRNTDGNDKALEVCRKMYDEAKERNHNSGMGLAFYDMAKIYSRQRRFVEQEECLREAIVLMRDDNSTLNILVNCYSSLGFCLIAQKRYDEAIRITEESEAVIQRYSQGSQSRQSNARLNQFLVYLDAYIESGQFEEAETYCNKIDSISNHSVDINSSRARILASRKQFTAALELIDKAIEAKPEGKLGMMGDKMIILINKGDAAAAHNLFVEIIEAIYARQNEQLNAQLDEIRTLHEVDKHIAEKERNRNYFLFAVGVCLLLIIALGIWIHHSRTIIRKNRGLYLQIKEQDKMKAELQSFKQQYGIETNCNESLQGTKQQRQLVTQFCEYLQNNRNYTKADLNIDEIVAALATNKTYLFEALKIVENKTPKDYIRAMQLEDAKQLLEHDFKLSIETIAEECGFNTRNTFYRLFLERYQISPAEYRKMAINNA